MSESLNLNDGIKALLYINKTKYYIELNILPKLKLDFNKNII